MRRLAGAVTGAPATLPAGPAVGEEPRTALWAVLRMTTGLDHGVVVLVMTRRVHVCVPAESETGEEDGCDDEHNPGDDRNPCGDLEEPVRVRGWRWRDGARRWDGRDRGRRGGGFRCFTHTSNHAGATNSPGYALLMNPL